MRVPAIQLPENMLRWLLITFLLGTPALTAWNIYASAHGKRVISIGKPLDGAVEKPAPVPFNAAAFADGSWQKSATGTVTDAIPNRPLLIRLSNNARVALFSRYASEEVLVGENGHLIEKFYQQEYCRRDLEILKKHAPAWIAKLRELQDFYAARKKIFIYELSPSKMAHFPELFLPHYPCANSESDRKQWLPVYTDLLRRAGINFVDSATSIHALKGKYPLDMFPQGGVHWNQIGWAHAGNELIAEINRQGFTPPLPEMKWSYKVSKIARGLDRDLLDLVNVLFPNPRYDTPDVSYEPAACPAYRRPLDIAYIGSSFTHPIAEVLTLHGCLPDMLRYNYLYRTVWTGDKRLRNESTREQIAELRKSDIVILEENEAVIPGSQHAMEFYRVILGK